MTQTIQIIIVDDHPLIREGVKQILSFYPHIHIIAEGSNGHEAIELVNLKKCDLLLLDINMPKLSGIDAVRHIRTQHPTLKILLLTVENDFHTLKEAIDLQVDGYILKDSAGTTLLSAIEHIYTGGNFIDQALTKHVFHIVQDTETEPLSSSPAEDPFDLLSDREKEVLFYISKGYSNKEIASKLYLSDKTIRNCITNIFKKINVKDRVQATIFALNHNIENHPKIG